MAVTVKHVQILSCSEQSVSSEEEEEEEEEENISDNSSMQHGIWAEHPLFSYICSGSHYIIADVEGTAITWNDLKFVLLKWWQE
jgi:hypothetical protein